ncbi:MAG: DUF2853 family protein [Verrucomicrobiales bacterium]|nr:DUF2853 family protein [Verrucomicrobiales bacterium]
MSKLDDLCVKYAKELEGLGEKVDAKLLRAVAKACGPSIYRADASLVAVTDPKEVNRVKRNFCMAKLGLKDTPKTAEGIDDVKKKYNKRRKLRAVFYYLLVKRFKKASVFK